MLGTLVDRLLDRSVVFDFDRTGCWRHRARFREGDLDVDVGGRICLVTGATSGLGDAPAGWPAGPGTIAPARTP